MCNSSAILQSKCNLLCKCYKEVVQRYNTHKMQQSKLTMLLLLTNGKSVLYLLFDFLLLSLTLCEFWCSSSLQLQTLKAAVFDILANSNDSRKFLICPRAGTRRKWGPQGQEQRESTPSWQQEVITSAQLSAEPEPQIQVLRLPLPDCQPSLPIPSVSPSTELPGFFSAKYLLGFMLWELVYN